MDKQKQIEEMKKKMQKCYEKNGLLNFKWFAETLFDLGYRKIPENAVVLTREEYENLIDKIAKEITSGVKTDKNSQANATPVKKNTVRNSGDLCVCCGEYAGEGRQVCVNCTPYCKDSDSEEALF